MTRPINLGMRILFLLLCLACLVSLVRPVSAVAKELAENQTYTTIVHMNAKASSLAIGQLENGTAVTVLKATGSLYKVDCYDMVGYIAKSQLRKDDDGKYYVNCDPASSETRVLTYTEPAEALELRHSLLALAKKQLGSRYVYGGMKPGSFDCSGLTSYLYKNHDIKLNRRASLQLQNGIIVPKDALQVGDLIFFRHSGKYPADHVGIYAGNNQLIHASFSNGVVYDYLDVSYFKDYYLCARRVINTGALQPEMPLTRSAAATLVANSVSGRTVG